VKALVTGATGKLGHAVALALRARGDHVRALVRDPDRASRVLPPEVELARGDARDTSSLERAAEGRELVFNAMGLPEQWLADPETFAQVNARGAENVVRAARAAGVRRVVHTSTIDVFQAAPGSRFDESRLADYPKGTPYERSKQRAEALALAAAGGTELVIVNPAAVYGPGPGSSVSFDRQLFEPVVNARRLALPALPPGGFGIVYSHGAAAGQLLAAERGRPGERYILCDRHVTLRELADVVVRAAGRGRVPPTLPVGVARAMALAGETLSGIVRRPPLLPRGQLYFFLWNTAPDAGKAERELGWKRTPLLDGVRETLAAMDPALV
jgi:nucleoside-diphosphate-sugar epimerase